MKLPKQLEVGRLLLVADLIGTGLFAAQGAAVGTAAHLDLLGVLVFSFLSSAGGGMLRDLLIGATPPAAIKNWRYPATAFVTGGAIFGLHRFSAGLPPWVLATLDAAGNAFYSIAGALKALEFGLHPLPAVLMAGVTGTGGGLIRDVLMMRVPLVLRADFYASASLLGGTATMLLLRAGQPTRRAMWGGIVLCFTLRMLAIRFHWHLPHF